jgi:hypothetical protein
LAYLLSFGGFFLLHEHPLESVDHLKPSLHDIRDLNGLRHTLASVFSLAQQIIEYPSLDLHQIGAHNHIEHDASITHDDIISLPSIYAPPSNNGTLFSEFIADSQSGTHITATDIGRARTRRERQSKLITGRGIDRLHADIARGEAALVLSVFGDPAPGQSLTEAPWGGPGVLLDTIRTFWWDERLPKGWTPVRETTIESIKDGKSRILSAMNSSANASFSFSPTPQVVLAA